MNVNLLSPSTVNCTLFGMRDYLLFCVFKMPIKTLENSLAVLQKIKHRVISNPAIHLYPRELKHPFTQKHVPKYSEQSYS